MYYTIIYFFLALITLTLYSRYEESDYQKHNNFIIVALFWPIVVIAYLVIFTIKHLLLFIDKAKGITKYKIISKVCDFIFCNYKYFRKFKINEEVLFKHYQQNVLVVKEYCPNNFVVVHDLKTKLDTKINEKELIPYTLNKCSSLIKNI